MVSQKVRIPGANILILGRWGQQIGRSRSQGDFVNLGKIISTKKEEEGEKDNEDPRVARDCYIEYCLSE